MTSVLVVEDEINIRETIDEILKLNKFQVKTATCGEEALEILESYKPDLIVCDIMMPGMSGYDVIERVHSRDEWKSLPFIFLTAKTKLEDRRQGMCSGADDYLTKPFRADELLDAIQSRLDRFKMIKAKYQERLAEIRNHFNRYSFHEMNTPLNGIIGGLEYLLNYHDVITREEKTEMLTVINISTKRLQRTLYNIIYYLNTDRFNALFLSKKLSSVEYGLEQALFKLGEIHDTQRINVKIESGFLELPTAAYIFILEELLDNALKFSSGKSKVRIVGVKTPFTYDIQIIDDGIGWNAWEISHIGPFKQFGRDEMEQQGLGLGLYLSTQVMKSFNIVFQLVGSPNIGTIITLKIPIGKSIVN